MEGVKINAYWTAATIAEVVHAKPLLKVKVPVTLTKIQKYSFYGNNISKQKVSIVKLNISSLQITGDSSALRTVCGSR